MFVNKDMEVIGAVYFIRIRLNSFVMNSGN